MTQANLDSFSTSYMYKMDNVLYEIYDNNGISKDQEFDPWKTEVISSLETATFINVVNNNYMLTQKGREVINCDSLVYYHRQNRASRKKAAREQKTFFEKLFLRMGANL